MPKKLTLRIDADRIAAARTGAEAIVTRSGKDFRRGPRRVLTPPEWLTAAAGGA